MPPYLTSRGCWGTGGDVTCPGLHTWRVLSLGFELRSTQIFPPACFTKGTEKLNQRQGLHRLNSCQILTMWPEAGAPSSTHIRWSHIASLELLSPRGAAAGSGCASPSWAESEGHVSVITAFKVIWIFSDAQNTFLNFFLLIQELKCQPGSWIYFFVMWIECNTTSKNIYPDFALILTLDYTSWIIAIVFNPIFHSNM